MSVPNTDHIAQDNQLKSAWEMLNSFSLSLRAIATALVKLESGTALDYLNVDLDLTFAETDMLKVSHDTFRCCRAFVDLAKKFSDQVDQTKK